MKDLALTQLGVLYRALVVYRQTLQDVGDELEADAANALITHIHEERQRRTAEMMNVFA